jgi:hypothetical protein
MEVERLTLSEWDDALPGDGFEVFHLADALEVLDEHAAGNLRLYGGFKGDQPVALLPTFVRRMGVGRAVTSPPPSMAVPRLGPLVMPNSPKQRKRESVNRRFVEGVMDDLGVDGSMSVCRILCPLTYDDPRPFRWGELELQPSFTYVLAAEGPADDLMGSFSKSLRRELRSLIDSDVTVGVEDHDAARTVYDDVAARYAEQGEEFGPTWEYVSDLVSALGARARVYVARAPDGRYLSGVIALYSNDAAYYWLGGSRASYDNDSVNSLVHWAILRDLLSDPPVDAVSRYDLVGANTERLCRYKAKFGGEVVPYFVVESPGKSMDLAKRAYRFVRG